MSNSGSDNKLCICTPYCIIAGRFQNGGGVLRVGLVTLATTANPVYSYSVPTVKPIDPLQPFEGIADGVQASICPVSEITPCSAGAASPAWRASFYTKEGGNGTGMVNYFVVGDCVYRG